MKSCPRCGSDQHDELWECYRHESQRLHGSSERVLAALKIAEQSAEAQLAAIRQMIFELTYPSVGPLCGKRFCGRATTHLCTEPSGHDGACMSRPVLTQISGNQE